MLCEKHAPGEIGRYSRALLHGLQAWLADAEGDDAGVARRALARCGPRPGRRARRDPARVDLLEGPLKALEAEALDPEPVVAAIEAAWPEGRRSCR